MAFGLNALYGRLRLLDGSYAGSWDPSNARNFVQYTVDRGHEVQAWELGTVSFPCNYVQSGRATNHDLLLYQATSWAAKELVLQYLPSNLLKMLRN